MVQKKSSFGKILLAGSLITVSLAGFTRANTPISYSELGNAGSLRSSLTESEYSNLLNLDLKCGSKKTDHKCGSTKDTTKMGKTKDHKCGEGKCAADKKASGKSKVKDGKCGEGKCGGKDTTKAQHKAKDGKCGEGKCGNK